MPSLNSIRLATDKTGVNATPFTSAIVRVQGVREELVVIWVHVQSPDGSTCRIQVAPDDAAAVYGGGEGMTYHTIITTGTAGPGQTKINGQGHASVVLTAHPRMHVILSGGLNTAIWNVWLIE